MSNVLSKSDNMKSEYCCSVVKIGELTPIDGSDFLAKTNVLGTQIVVRKDQVHEGDVMFYSSNETSLNEKFLSVNNLFEIGCRDMNSNASEVNAIMQEYNDNYKNKSIELKAEAKKIKSMITSLTNSANKLKKKASSEEKKLTEETDESKKIELQNSIKSLRKSADEKTKKAMEKTVEYTNLKNEIESLVKAGQPIVDKAKKLVGFFGKYGRVRCLKLKGEPSFGFVFSKNEMIKYCPEIESINLEDYVGEDFDTVNGELFVKAYVPPVKEVRHSGSRGDRRNKKVTRFNRLVEGEFKYHYDTNQLQKEINRINPNDSVVLSVKLHGTSCIIGKLHVKEPKKIAPHKWLWNKFIDLTGLFKDKRVIDYNVVYGPVYSSRTVIKNQYINKDVNSGFYSVDLWTEWGNKIYPYLSEGMTVYGEIVGYVTGKETMIQKTYDYGCEPGTNKLMIYRITSDIEDGRKFEWNVNEVYDWTLHLIKEMTEKNDETAKQIHPIDILYNGLAKDIYPELDTENHWHENLLDKLKNDKEHFGMEEFEPLCTYNSVPREGFVLRINDDPIVEAWKLKTDAFKFGEAVRVDAGEVDIEMLDNYVAQGDEDIIEKNNE